MDYRLYFLNAQGHIRSSVDLECDGDARAIRVAAGASDGREMELWCRDRQVKVFLAGLTRPERPPLATPMDRQDRPPGE
jgi:hypothetical protein